MGFTLISLLPVEERIFFFFSSFFVLGLFRTQILDIFFSPFHLFSAADAYSRQYIISKGKVKALNGAQVSGFMEY